MPRDSARGMPSTHCSYSFAVDVPGTVDNYVIGGEGRRRREKCFQSTLQVWTAAFFRGEKKNHQDVCSSYSAHTTYRYQISTLTDEERKRNQPNRRRVSTDQLNR